MALTDYSIDTSGTPQDVQRRQKLAEALMQQSGDTSPAAGGKNGGWLTGINRALAGALGGYQAGQANSMAQGQRKQEADLMASYPGANPVASRGTVPQSLSKAAPDTSGKIYNNDEPSPLDPPSGDDRKKMMATILGEAGNEPQLGKNAVASVIRTRAVDGGYGGDTPSGVVTAPNQFEPWNTPEGRARMAAALADPKQAAAADAAVRSAYGEGGKAPEDPTEGMTHFFSPKGQAAMGRPAPAWAGGESMTIGGHVFNSPDDAGGKPVQVASAQGFAPQDSAVAAVNGAASGQPQQIAQADPQAAQRQALASWAQKAMLSTNPQTRQMALQTIEQLNKQQGLINAGSGKIYDPTTKTWLTPPKDPEADIPDNFEKGPDGVLRPVKGGPADPEYVKSLSAAKHPPGTPMDEPTADFLADRVLAGDTKALVGLGRGAQGAENLAKIQGLVAQKAKSGAPVSEGAKLILDNAAQQAGLVSSARALGTKETHFGVAEKAMEESLPLAQKASDNVPRTEWLTANKLIQLGQTEHANPELKRFLIATDTAAKDYARTINPTGTLRESDIAYARKILSTTDGPEAYKQALDQLRMEAGVMHRAIQRQKDELHGKKPEAAPATGEVTIDGYKIRAR